MKFVNYYDFKSLIPKGSKFREPQSLNWHYNFIVHILNSVEDTLNNEPNIKKKAMTRCQNGLKVYDAC